MPPIVYTRRDQAIRIASTDSGVEILTTQPDGMVLHTIVAREVLDRGALGDDIDIRLALAGAWGDTSPKAQWSPIIERIIVEVSERKWSAIAFESFLLPGTLLVRTSPVRPRTLQRPLAFPLRILETGPQRVVPAAIEQTFGSTYRGDAFIDEGCMLEEACAFVREKNWASVDILHVHGFTPSPDTLSTARVNQPGTVGWLLRFAETFQTRLIVFECDQTGIARLRIAAQSMLDRGGPAIWLFGGLNDYADLYGGIAHDRPLDWIRGHVSGELFAGRGAEEALRYSPIGETLARPDVVQDVVGSVVKRMRASRKLDPQVARRRGPKPRQPQADEVSAAIMDSVRRLRIPIQHTPTGTVISYYALWGTHAERLGNTISTELVGRGYAVPGLDIHLRNAYDQGADVGVESLIRHVQTTARPLTGITRVAASDLLGATLLRVGEEMPSYRFEDHESEGMLPLAGKVAELRVIADMLMAERPTYRKEASYGAGRTARHVNLYFCETASDNRLERLPQATARLKAGKTVHLEVEIATKVGSKSLGSTVFLEEQIRWSEDGAWIEIGVAGIDFEVLGDPVQEVWLPLGTPMDQVIFAVQPRSNTTVPGVARLRVAIYQNNNLIQCFLVAALLESSPNDAAAAIAKALNTTAGQVRRLGEVGYLPRLEYATKSIDTASTHRRGLTIIANDSAGEKVVTLKGKDLFTVRIDPTLPDKVKRVREALDRASERNGTYRYTFQRQVNSGDPKELLPVLWDIAEAGFDIFNSLVRDPDDQARVRETLADGDGIHAAHIDASSIIPWSLVYDRPVLRTPDYYENPADPKAPVYEVESAICPASMPGADGKMPAVECGGEGCYLNASFNEARKKAGDPIFLADTVICPRRFWGFMVPIEVPAQQVDGLHSRKTTPIAEVIKAGKPLTVVGGFNPYLEFATSHAADLENNVFTTMQNQVATQRAAMVTPARPGRDALRQLLLQADPEIVYLFCHALASLQKEGKTYGPALDFGKGHDGIVEDVLEAREFAGKGWTRAPLVFINGCSTAGFSPYAPSEFIKQFIQGRRAAAVIGTEVTVWEALATEMARRFLSSFLGGQSSAGQALLQSRRALLAMNNPLGLAYTLYGSADLTLGVA